MIPDKLSGLSRRIATSNRKLFLVFQLISLERYVAVCSPFNARQRLTVKKARSAFILILILAFLYNAPRFFEYSLDEKRGYVQLLRGSFYYFAIYFTTLYLITHFLGPFLVITILNVVIFKAIRRARYERTQLSNSRIDKRTIRKHQTTRMITLVTVIFGLCNILPFVLNIWEALDTSLFRGELRVAAYLTLDISNVLVVLNSSTTFIIYFVHCQKYRSIIVARLFRCCRSNTVPLRDVSEHSEKRSGDNTRVCVTLSFLGNSVTRNSGD